MQLDRRSWLKLSAALGFLQSVEVELDAQEPARSQVQAAPPQRVDAAMLHQALQLIGLDFTADEEKMMLPGVNRAFQSYGTLRQIPIPLDTDPAIRFDPRLAGVSYPSGPSTFVLSFHATARKTRSWKSVEELAFLPVTELAPLIRTHQVTSVDLTNMYLDRLKRYGPKLNCV